MIKWKAILYGLNIFFMMIILWIAPVYIGFADVQIAKGIQSLEVAKEKGATQQDSTYQETDQEWQKLNEKAEEALFLAKKNEFVSARKMVQQLEKEYLELDKRSLFERIEQENLISEVIKQAKQSLNRTDIQSQEVIRNLTVLRLTLDAVSHQKQPLWVQYYPSMIKTIQDIDDAIKENQRDSFNQYLNQLLAYYELVRPAMILSHEQGVVEQLDSQLIFLTKDRAERWLNKDHTLQMLTAIERQLKMAFFQEVDQGLHSFLFIIFGIGTMICTVLGYVAWRKYKGEKEGQVIWKRRISHER